VGVEQPVTCKQVTCKQVTSQGQVTCIGSAIWPTRLEATTFHDAKGLYLPNSPHTQHPMHKHCQLAHPGAQRRGAKHTNCRAHKLQSTTRTE